MFRGQRKHCQITLLVSLYGTAAYADPQWALIAVDGPAPRTQLGMVWDSCRNVVVLHGGVKPPTRFGDTWEWNGSEWALRTTTGLGERSTYGMAFDSDRCRTVLFGGIDGSGNYMNDTWEWDGTTWTQKGIGCSPPQPGTRDVSGMTYDTAQHVAVMFGGYAPGLLNDTWKWDGTCWTQVTTNTPPSPRAGHAMGYDAARQRIVLFGGNLVPTTCGTNSDETWELDLSTNPATWTQITTTPHPSPRDENAHMVYDPSGSRMLLFGGTDGCTTTYNDTWEYDAGVWTQIPTPTAPEGRHGHDMAYDTIRQEVVLFGGDHGPINNYDVRGDTWTFGDPPDSDGDGVPDADDGCPDDAGKIEPGICGCGVADTDTDGDDTADCDDPCPTDPNKISPGICGCDVDDTIGFIGFLPPIGGADATGGSFADPLRAFKLGSTIPVKFTASQCSYPLLTGIHTLAAGKYGSDVDFDAPIDATPTDAATTGNQFRLTDGQWHFNLSTRSGFSQGTWKLIATLSDGSAHYVWITIKK